MHENTAWVIIICFLIAVAGSCTVIEDQNKTQRQKIQFEAEKYCYDNGGERSWSGWCVLEKKKVP